ncbi:MBL fold metallo-hydrolase [Paracoccus salsus]|uniref:MBL fold metallo-hydrolase n=1 Tax=Paracoccus salsus TaxID=2911061 RepID=UPI001F19BEE9|nr:MBL fold metallo-hydrolase [Paracoccus salsus]MCF3974464.1 MBL fold metallo-hydrolase [Paracoccus salsus]
MRLNRRHFLHTATAFSLLGGRAWAATETRFEDFVIRTVSDGKLVLPIDFLMPEGADQQQIASLLQEAGVSGETYDSPLNLTLMQRGEDLILFDAGSGPDFMPTAGRLPDALAAMGIAPDQITHVLFTHAHPDHIWGVLDDFDEPIFRNAQHLINRVERDFWLDPATMETIDPSRQTFVAGARRRIETLGDRLEVFEDGDEVLPGVTALMTPGHTPGHTSFDLAGQAFVIGDAVTTPHMGFHRPDLPSGSDQNPERGAETRVSMLTRLADSGVAVVGYHLPDGGIGKVVRDGDAFAFQSA